MGERSAGSISGAEEMVADMQIVVSSENAEVEMLRSMLQKETSNGWCVHRVHAARVLRRERTNITHVFHLHSLY